MSEGGVGVQMVWECVCQGKAERQSKQGESVQNRSKTKTTRLLACLLVQSLLTPLLLVCWPVFVRNVQEMFAVLCCTIIFVCGLFSPVVSRSGNFGFAFHFPRLPSHQSQQQEQEEEEKNKKNKSKDGVSQECWWMRRRRRRRRKMSE